MSMSSHNSLMMLLLKLAPQSLRSLATALKIEIYPCHRNLATVFAVWSGVTQAMTCFVKLSQKTKMLTTFGGWSNSIVISVLVKPMFSNSNGAVAMMCCIVLDASLIFANGLLHLHCHSGPPELVM